MTSQDGYVCRRTGYAGHEQEILRLRNANRAAPKDAGYMAWRYRERQGVPSPEVFWLDNPEGQPIGMASLLFHRYWDGERAVDVPVLGDISLEGGQRGKGLGLQLLRFVTARLEEAYADRRALVIPTDAAHRSLAVAGWTDVGRLQLYTLVLNPRRRLPVVLGRTEPAQFAAWLYRGLARRILSPGHSARYRMELDLRPGSDLEALWRARPVEDRLVRDRDIDALTWRYLTHPSGRYRLAGVRRGDDLIGAIAYEGLPDTFGCTVHDFIVRHHQDLRPVIAAFARHWLDAGTVDALHLALNEGHPATREFRRLGFLPRPSEARIQEYVPGAVRTSARSAWSITYGDKDV